jgi:hypothetical protein
MVLINQGPLAFRLSGIAIYTGIVPRYSFLSAIKFKRLSHRVFSGNAHVAPLPPAPVVSSHEYYESLRLDYSKHMANLMLFLRNKGNPTDMSVINQVKVFEPLQKYRGTFHAMHLLINKILESRIDISNHTFNRILSLYVSSCPTIICEQILEYLCHIASGNEFRSGALDLSSKRSSVRIYFFLDKMLFSVKSNGGLNRLSNHVIGNLMLRVAFTAQLHGKEKEENILSGRLLEKCMRVLFSQKYTPLKPTVECWNALLYHRFLMHRNDTMALFDNMRKIGAVNEHSYMTAISYCLRHMKDNINNDYLTTLRLLESEALSNDGLFKSDSSELLDIDLSTLQPSGLDEDENSNISKLESKNSTSGSKAYFIHGLIRRYACAGAIEDLCRLFHISMKLFPDVNSSDAKSPEVEKESISGLSERILITSCVVMFWKYANLPYDVFVREIRPWIITKSGALVDDRLLPSCISLFLQNDKTALINLVQSLPDNIHSTMPSLTNLVLRELLSADHSMNMNTQHHTYAFPLHKRLLYTLIASKLKIPENSSGSSISTLLKKVPFEPEICQLVDFIESSGSFLTRSIIYRIIKRMYLCEKLSLIVSLYHTLMIVYKSRKHLFINSQLVPIYISTFIHEGEWGCVKELFILCKKHRISSVLTQDHDLFKKIEFRQFYSGRIHLKTVIQDLEASNKALKYPKAVIERVGNLTVGDLRKSKTNPLTITIDTRGLALLIPDTRLSASLKLAISIPIDLQAFAQSWIDRFNPKHANPSHNKFRV